MVINKVIVETKSRSKHVFELEDETANWLVENIGETGFKAMSFLKIHNTFFNPDNVTSVKIEKVG